MNSLPIVRPKPGERVPPVKTQARSATILPNFVGLIFQVHNGKTYNDVRITEDMVVVAELGLQGILSRSAGLNLTYQPVMLRLNLDIWVLRSTRTGSSI